MKRYMFAILLFLSQNLISQKLQQQEVASDSTYSGVEIIDSHQHRKWIDFKKDSLSCIGLINILKESDEIKPIFVETTCAGKFPALVLFLNRSGLNIKLYTFAEFVDDYLNLTPEEYVGLYENARIWKVAVIRDREYRSSILRIKQLTTGRFELINDY